jgi:hypothetical protein
MYRDDAQVVVEDATCGVGRMDVQEPESWERRAPGSEAALLRLDWLAGLQACHFMGKCGWRSEYSVICRSVRRLLDGTSLSVSLPLPRIRQSFRTDYEAGELALKFIDDVHSS